MGEESRYIAGMNSFGHRVYKNYDPRARIIRKYLDDVFEVRGKSPLLEVATELEKRALDDEYFTSRKLYPNVDFYSGLIYEALGLPVAMFPVMFAIGRTSGWIAQWKEIVGDPEQKIARPRQIYTGERDSTTCRSSSGAERVCPSISLLLNGSTEQRRGPDGFAYTPEASGAVRAPEIRVSLACVAAAPTQTTTLTGSATE